jgi:hypothetical protein
MAAIGDAAQAMLDLITIFGYRFLADVLLLYHKWEVLLNGKEPNSRMSPPLPYWKELCNMVSKVWALVSSSWSWVCGFAIDAYAFVRSCSWSGIMLFPYWCLVQIWNMVSKAYEFASVSQLLLFLCYYFHESDLLLTAIVLGHLLLAWFLCLLLPEIEDEFQLLPDEIDPADDHFEHLPIGAHLFMSVGLAAAALFAIRTYYSWEATGLVLMIAVLGLLLGFFFGGRDPDNGGLHPLVIALEDACLALWRWILWPLASLWDRIGTSAGETAALRVQLAEANASIQELASTSASETKALRVKLETENANLQKLLDASVKETEALKVELAAAKKKIERLEDRFLDHYRRRNDGSGHNAPGGPGGPDVSDINSHSDSDDESGNGGPRGARKTFSPPVFDSPSRSESDGGDDGGHSGTGQDVVHVTLERERKEKEMKEREEKEREEKERKGKERKEKERKEKVRKDYEWKEKIRKEKEMKEKERKEKERKEKERKEKEEQKRKKKESEEQAKKKKDQKGPRFTYSDFNRGKTNRVVLIKSANNLHAVVNPMEDIPGLGDLMFLSAADRLEANRRGYATPRDVSMAHSSGELAVGTGTDASPIVVFRPDPATLNPTDQPHGPGAWRFLTSAGETSDRGRAASQLGGTRGLPWGPSARHIHLLRQLFWRNGRPNLAAHIDIVWVPGNEDVEDDIYPVLELEDYEENDDVPGTSSLHDQARDDSPAAPEPTTEEVTKESTATHLEPSAASSSSNVKPHHDAPAEPKSTPLAGTNEWPAPVPLSAHEEAEPRNNLPISAVPVVPEAVKKIIASIKPSLHVEEPRNAVPAGPQVGAPGAINESTPPSSSSPDTKAAKLPINLDSASQRKNDPATDSQEDVKSSATAEKDPSSMNYYERHKHNRKSKLAGLKEKSTWIAHDNAQGKQIAQPTTERQPVPAAGVHPSSADRDQRPPEDLKRPQENGNGAT